MKGIVLLFVFGLMLPTTVYAGWFGPDNYEDCVLEKMKGQNANMRWVAISACEKEFGVEKELSFSKEEFDTSWHNTYHELIVDIKKNETNYVITKISAVFSAESCDGSSKGTGNTFSTYLHFPSGSKRASVTAKEAEQYKCMRTKHVWGKWDN